MGKTNTKLSFCKKNGLHKRLVHFSCNILFWVGQNTLTKQSIVYARVYIQCLYYLGSLTLRRAAKGRREKAFDYLLCDPEAKKDTRLKG